MPAADSRRAPLDVKNPRGGPRGRAMAPPAGIREPFHLDLGVVRQGGRSRPAALVVPADKGYIGAGEHVHTPPYRGRNNPVLSEGRQLRTRPRRMGGSQLKPGTSCPSSAASPGRPASRPRPTTPFKPGRSRDEKAHWARLSHIRLLCAPNVAEQRRYSAERNRRDLATRQLSTTLTHCDGCRRHGMLVSELVTEVARSEGFVA